MASPRAALALRFARFTLANARPQQQQRHCHHARRMDKRFMSALAQPMPDGEDKQYPPKIANIVSEISKLTLIEVADLNELLKKTLNIQDAPMVAAVAPSAAPSDADDDGAKISKVQTAFTVKLVKFDETKKIALIKEMKNLIDGSNLVQAKKFVESAPQIVKADLPKEEADALKKTIEAAGGICEII